MTLIGAVFEGHAFLDMPTAGAALGRGEPARSDKEIPSRIGDFGLEELQKLPHRRIRHGTRQLSVGHHPQNVEVFDADHSAGSRQSAS